MRLLNTETLEQLEFVSDDRPQYAILSHRWGTKEVSLQDYERGVNRDDQGWAKITTACNVAKKDLNLGWLWVDTCCIDKTSSAELSEAINSMWRYYAESAVCIAYLSDVQPRGDQSDHRILQSSGFCESQWFTRRWTLQELIAPKAVVFYSMAWQIIGARNAMYRSLYAPEGNNQLQDVLVQCLDLSQTISETTGIPQVVLEHSRHHETYSVYNRIKWARDRETTRIEDQAYCLMGLLDVNMPLLYGEGYKAFLRIQQEVLQSNLDESILAWAGSTFEVTSRKPRQHSKHGLRLSLVTCAPMSYQEEEDKRMNPVALSGLLASSPSHFGLNGLNCSVMSPSRGELIPRVNIQAGLIRFDIGDQDECHRLDQPDHIFYVIQLRCTFDRKSFRHDRASTTTRPCYIFLIQSRCGHFKRATGSDTMQTITLDLSRAQIIPSTTIYIQLGPRRCCPRSESD